jgi:hypothetical protein
MLHDVARSTMMENRVRLTRLIFSFLIGVPLLILNIAVVSPPYTVVISSMSVAWLQ